MSKLIIAPKNDYQGNVVSELKANLECEVVSYANLLSPAMLCFQLRVWTGARPGSS